MADYTDWPRIDALVRSALSEERVLSDLRAVLAEAGGAVEFDEGSLQVSEDVPVAVVARSVHRYDVPMGFGDHMRVVVAVGGVTQIEHGIPSAGLCFATLWYTTRATLITVDFSKGVP